MKFFRYLQGSHIIILFKVAIRFIIFGGAAVLLCAIALCARILTIFQTPREQPHLVFAGKPITGLYKAAETMKLAGFKVLTIANDKNFIGEHERFDAVLTPNPADPAGLRTLYFAARTVKVFAIAIMHYDILHAYINGGILGRTVLSKWEFSLWKLAGKRLVLMAYGSDSLVYQGQPQSPWFAAISETYPHDGAADKAIARRLKSACNHADAVIGCLIHWTGLPKVTHNPLLWYPIEDFGDILPVTTCGTIRIGHAPNHRKIKGTQAIIDAVKALQADGHDIELEIIEKTNRNKVIERLKTCDIIIDQLLMGYALSCLEGMALGKIVITGIDLNDPVYAPHRPVLETCPLIFASEANIEATLRGLIEKREAWPQIARKISSYGAQQHSPKWTQAFFKSIYSGF